MRQEHNWRESMSEKKQRGHCRLRKVKGGPDCEKESAKNPSCSGCQHNPRLKQGE